MQKMKKTVSMVLAGDSFITQRLPRDAKLAAGSAVSWLQPLYLGQ